MFDSNVHTLLDVSVTDFLVDEDSDSGFRNVVDNTGLAVVDLVRHTFLNRAIGLDVDDISNPRILSAFSWRLLRAVVLVVSEIGLKRNVTLLLVLA